MRIHVLRPALAALIVLVAGCNFESATGPGSSGGPTDNALPVANAGEDRTVIDTDRSGNEAVAMDGSASMDPDGTIATHIWSTNGHFLAAGPNPTITLVPGEHVVTLAVTDNRGAAATDDVLITVLPGTGNANIPPTANAGSDQTVSDNDGNGSETITLNGSGSSDPDGGVTRWVWTEGGTQVGLGEQAQASLGVGRHVITLTVADANGATDTDTVVITVNGTGGSGNTPPVADAGPDQVVVDDDGNGSEHFWVDGSGSYDPDGTIVSEQWSVNGSALSVDSSDRTRLDQGTHTVTLTVTDNDGATDTDTVIIQVVEEGSNNPPIANAGSDQVVEDLDGNGSETVSLNGSATDSDGTIVSVVWSEGSSQLATGASASVTLAVGTHNLTLRATDDGGATDTDNVTITVLPVGGNLPPTANAGSDRSVTDSDGNGSETVSLNGSSSSDADGSIASWVWRENGSQIATGATASVTLAVGSHTITLTVTDNDGDTATDTVVLTVNAPSAISYSADIQPYFNQRCTSCHGSSGGASLRSYADTMDGGRSGAMVVPGDATRGTLVEYIARGHKGAPHGTSIEQDVIDWINAGALDN